MSQQIPKICPNCRQFNPVDATICGYCGTPLTNWVNPTPAPTTTDIALPVELIRDWFGIYFSLGFNLERFTKNPRNWLKFSIGLVVVALLNGITGLVWAFLVLQFDTTAFAANMGDALDMVSEGFRLDMNPKVDADILIIGTLLGFGATFTVTLYMIFIHYCVVFFGGRGDLSDLFHMTLSANIVSSMLAPLVLLSGTIDIFVFIAVALLWMLYIFFLEMRIIQTVYQVNIAIAVLTHILTASLFPCCWSMFMMLGA